MLAMSGEIWDATTYFRSCHRMKGYWRDVQRIIQKFCDCEMPEDPAFFLLHDFKISVETYKNVILCHLLNAARSCILLRWKKIQPPTVGMWLRKVEELNQLEKMVWTERQKREKYKETWSL